MIRKVAVALSGGVDSAVAAILLLKKGFTVSGVYMKNWDFIDEIGYCSGNCDREDAKSVCSDLKIPFYEVSFVQEYWNHVFMDFIEDYQNGLTPNPDILCNKHIKFDKLLEYVLKTLGADALATGHYANNSFGPFLQSYDPAVNPKLLTATDKRKDQTFFLCQISSDALKKTMFPLGNLKKATVKDIARDNNLNHIADKKESQGICFIGPRHFQSFISEYISPSKGKFIDADSGIVVGEHNGVHQWTVGQRCKIGGLHQAYYVAEKTKGGDIYVVSGHEHPALYSSLVSTLKPHWIHFEPEKLHSNEGALCQMRFQHGKPLTQCHIHHQDDGGLKVCLEHPLRALTPGQFAVFYQGNICLGGARLLPRCIHDKLSLKRVSYITMTQ